MITQPSFGPETGLQIILEMPLLCRTKVFLCINIYVFSRHLHGKCVGVHNYYAFVLINSKDVVIVNWLGSYLQVVL